MPADFRIPFAVSVCNRIVSTAAWLVPAKARGDWKREWQAEVWHRWRFFVDAGEWNRKEALLLMRSSAGSFADAAWYLASEEKVQHRVKEIARSPWTCLGSLVVLILALTWLSGGLPATRDLLHPVASRNPDRLAVISLQSQTGRRELGLHADLLSSWQKESKLLLGMAPFRFAMKDVAVVGQHVRHLQTIETDARLFKILGVAPEEGSIRSAGAILSYSAGKVMFGSSHAALGSPVSIAGRSYRVIAILPAGFRFLSREPSVYLMSRQLGAGRVLIAAALKPGAPQQQIETELNNIAQDPDAYWYNSRLRFTLLESTLLTPLRFFGISTFLTGLVVIALCNVRLRGMRLDWKSTGFMAVKASLALFFVFAGCLEWSRPDSALLLAWKDGASGPAIIWLYIAFTMAAWVWALADQRGRCPVCLRLLCFPVRVGCPGCLLLDWAGTELLCTQGHGMLHVPDMATSWDSESDRWVALDESWRGLFARTE